MKRPHIVYPDADASALQLLRGERSARLEAIGQLTVHEGRPGNHREYLRRVAGANVVLLGWDLPGEVMAQIPGLELIAFTGIGPETFVDLPAAARQGVTVTNTPGYADDAVAEHALALLLAVARKIPQQDRALRGGAWAQVSGIGLRGKRLGLIGFGGIGQRMAQLGRGIGLRVTAWTPHPERHANASVPFAPLERVLGESDLLSVHVALSASTSGLIGPEQLAQMKPGVILVNTARGPIIDQGALVEHLRRGTIAGAGLDVFSTEPLPHDDPLRELDNVVLTPHSAYSTPEATAAIHDLAIEAIESYCAGRPRYVVRAPNVL